MKSNHQADWNMLNSDVLTLQASVKSDWTVHIYGRHQILLTLYDNLLSSNQLKSSKIIFTKPVLKWVTDRSSIIELVNYNDKDCHD